MNIVIEPGPLAGEAVVPSSKSFAHRLLIAAALSDAPTLVRMTPPCADVQATLACLCALGARTERADDGLRVFPLRDAKPGRAALFCAESGSTLRFLLPVVCALGADASFSGAGQLAARPAAPLVQALRAHGAHISADRLPFDTGGTLCGGRYEIAGNVSSQYVTGLLFALPLCAQDSEIVLTTRLASAPYVDITLETLRLFSVRAEKTERGFFIPGRQRFKSPGAVQAEGDWSAAAFFLAANAAGSRVALRGLNGSSAQGDRAMSALLARLGGEIDVSAAPDLVPALSVAAALHPGVTRVTGAARLRCKESDRLRAVTAMLTALGGRCTETEDGLEIRGGRELFAGTVDGMGDHRIVMAAAVAATAAAGPVTVTGCEAAAKSYPAFFETFTQLGGKAHVQPDR